MPEPDPERRDERDAERVVHLHGGLLACRGEASSRLVRLRRRVVTAAMGALLGNFQVAFASLKRRVCGPPGSPVGSKRVCLRAFCVGHRGVLPRRGADRCRHRPANGVPGAQDRTGVDLRRPRTSPTPSIDGEVLNKLPGAQTLWSAARATIFAAYGRTADMQAWLADTDAQRR